MTRRSKSQRGFTLLEILVAMGILFIVLFAVTTFGLDVATFGGFLGENLNSHNELQQTFKTIKAEIRSMGPASNGSYPIESAAETSFIFFSDLDGDGLFERVRYYLEDFTLKKGVIKPTGNPLAYLSANEQIREVVHNIVNNPLILFFYYPQDVSGEGASLVFPVDPSVIRLVKIDLLTDADPQQLPEPTGFFAFITIRNLRGTL